MARLAVAVLVLWALGGPLPADESAVSAPTPDAAQIETGDRVRAKTKEGVITGTVASLGNGRLDLSAASWNVADREAPQSLLLEEIGTLKVSKGKKDRIKKGVEKSHR